MTHPTRRTFIAATAGASAALAGMAMAQGGDPVRVGLVGTGSRGCDLLGKLASINEARVVAVCDDYRPHLANGQAAAPDAKAFDAYEALLDHAGIEAVVVATPLYLHYPMCTAAIERGLPVFCEKTMCHSIDEARELAALVESRNAIFQVGLQRRANAIYDQAEAMIRTGMLGTVTTIQCQWHRNGDWRRPLPVDAGDDLERRLNWRLYWAYSQGLMAELGSHQLDVANRMINAAPTRVQASGGIDYWKDGREVYDTVFCTYDYEAPDAGEGKPQMVRVTFSSIQTNAYEGVTEVIMGTKGTLLLSQKMGLYYPEGVRPEAASGDKPYDGISGATLIVPESPWAHRAKPMEFKSDADDTRSELLAFVRAVRAGSRDTIANVRVGLENTATIVIANDAIRTGVTQAFPADCRVHQA